MEQAVIDFVQGRRVAVVGVSRSGNKFGNSALQELKQRGYQVYAVHPSAEEIGGEHCYSCLAELPGQVDGVLVSVPPQKAVQVLREAAAAGIHNVWLQQGCESAEALSVSKELGLNTVSKKCILMYATPVQGFHRWHRAFNKLIGQL